MSLIQTAHKDVKSVKKLFLETIKFFTPSLWLFRIGFVVAFLIMSAGAGILVFYCFPVLDTHTVDTATIRHGGGFAYMAPVTVNPGFLPGNSVVKKLFGSRSDSGAQPSVSTLQLHENGMPLAAPHSLHADITEKGLGRFSHWAGDIVIFSTSDNSNPLDNGRSYTIQHTVSPLWWEPLLLIVLGCAGLHYFLPKTLKLQKERKKTSTVLAAFLRIKRWLSTGPLRRCLFWGAAAMLWLYVNGVFVQLLSAPLPSPDTQGYLKWWVFRTIGYPALLDFYHLFFKSWAYLPLFQLNLLLAGMFGLAGVLVRVSKSYVLGWLFLALIFSAGNMLLSAADMMSEAFFSGFILIHLAFAYLLLTERKKWMGLLAGLALALAILVKSIAVVFLGPLFLFLLFASDSRKSILILILPAAIAWFVPSAYNYVYNGNFESSVAGGFALGGHVAWGMRADPNSAFPKEAALVEQRLKPVLAKRPAHFKDVDDYFTYTSDEYNALLWGNIVPELASHSKDCLPTMYLFTCTWKGCPQICSLYLNKVLLQLSKEAIANNSGKYIAHVLAHYYGMWKYSFIYPTDFVQGVADRAAALSAKYSAASNLYYELLSPVPVLRDARALAESTQLVNNNAGKRLVDMVFLRELFTTIVMKILHKAFLLLLIVSLFASALVFWLRKMAPAARIFCYTGLFINAYFLGTALAQPALVRYAWALQGAVAAFIVIGLSLAIGKSADLMKARKKTIEL